MPAVVNITNTHGATSGNPDTRTVANVESSSIRFKLADNSAIDSNNPIPIPAAGTNYSFIKQLRFSVASGLSGTMNNLRFYTTGTFGTGVGLNVRTFTPVTGVAATTSGTTTLAVSPSPSWTTNAFVGYVVEVTSGPASGDIRRITANDGNTLTVSSAFSAEPDAGNFKIEYFDPVNNAATQLTGTADAYTYTSGSPLSFAGSTTTTGAVGNYVTLQLTVGSTASPGTTSSCTFTFVYDET